MELDKLKNTWIALDERLRQAETLNDKLVREMVHTKASKAINRLTNFEIFGTIFTVLFIPFLFWILAKEGYTTLRYIIISVSIVYAVIGVFCQLWKIFTLLKVDFSKPASNNIKLVNKFNIQIQREKMATAVFLPMLIVAIVFAVSFKNSVAFQWASLICIFIATILVCVWQYKKVYDNNINSILKSLDELKELE